MCDTHEGKRMPAEIETPQQLTHRMSASSRKHLEFCSDYISPLIHFYSSGIQNLLFILLLPHALVFVFRQLGQWDTDMIGGNLDLSQDF